MFSRALSEGCAWRADSGMSALECMKGASGDVKGMKGSRLFFIFMDLISQYSLCRDYKKWRA